MKGTLSHKDGRCVLRYERRYAHPPEKVWRALTEPAQLAKWFPSSIEGERAQGARLRFVFEGMPSATLEGTLTIFEPPRLLEYSWGEDILRWELTPDGDGCKLVFEDSFPERSAAARDGSGWHTCLDYLAAAIAGIPADQVKTAGWAERYLDYLARLGFGDYPRFVKRGATLDIPGVEGQRFTSANGTQLSLLRATRDTDLAEISGDGEGYLLVIEGRFVLRMGEQELPLGPGGEFHFPSGLRLEARASAGTRFLLGSAAPRAQP